jgi:hypothetical protein
VLEHGAFVALGLLAIWTALLIPLTRGTLKAIPFTAASLFLALMIPFFWLGPEITELTILKVGSFKTNAEQATKYFDEIKAIRGKIEAEEKAISDAVASFDKEIAAARAETKQLQARMADRQLTDEQVAEIADKVKMFPGQQFKVTTYWDIKECMTISNRIYDALHLASWEYLKPERAEFLLGGVSGVLVYVNSKADEKTKNAADQLVRALNQANIYSEQRDENDPTPNNQIQLNVGTKP